MTMPDIRDSQFQASDPAVTPGDEYQDYFGFSGQEAFTLPDRKQQIFFKKMTEGERFLFQKKTSKDIKFNRTSGDAAVRADPAEERHELIMTSVTGWSLMRKSGNGWEPAPFSTGGAGSALSMWLKAADPKIVDDLELAIRKGNPWMQADQTVEEIDKEIENLQELRAQAVEREAKK
jgi:hypothetical protein